MTYRDMLRGDLVVALRHELDALPDLAGPVVVDSMGSAYDRDVVVVCVMQPLGRGVLKGYQPVTFAVLSDLEAGDIARVMVAMFDRLLRPWLRPDPPAIPSIDLFPRVTRLRAWLTRRRPWR